MKSADRTQSKGAITDAEVEQHIREFFERNYDLLKQQGGHVLAEGAKKQALEQSLLYWRKLKAIATTVTETEVKLALPGQTTPKGRPFVIEGIVDIVREGDEVRMYDLKTHEEAEVRADPQLYEDQLNVYAHIWKGARNQRLDGTAIIATRVPLDLRDALQAGNAAEIDSAMARWNPVIDLPFDVNEVAETIQDFGRRVDDIEDGAFTPPPPATLGLPSGTRRKKDRAGRQGAAPTFAQIRCRDCDGRFSCSSYREYRQTDAAPRSRQRAASSPDPNENEQRALDDWIEVNLGDETR